VRAKRKALALKQATKPRPIKVASLPTAPGELKEGVQQEDLSRLENEGGASGKIEGVVTAVENLPSN